VFGSGAGQAESHTGRIEVRYYFAGFGRSICTCRSYDRLNYVVYLESAVKAALRSGEHVTWNT
jgi:hypothetical protein